MDVQNGERETGAATPRIFRVAALVLGAAVVVIPYACGRAYRWWLGRNDPFEALNASIERFVARYRERQEIVRAFGDIGRGAIRR